MRGSRSGHPPLQAVRESLRQLLSDMSSIAEIQDKKEKETLKKYQPTQNLQDDRQLQHQESAAARVLQRTYRGHRERRQLRGMGLDPSTRWTEVCSLLASRFLFPFLPHPLLQQR